MNSRSNVGYIIGFQKQSSGFKGGEIVEKRKKKNVQVALPNAECRKETSLLVAVEKKAWQEKREVEIHAIKDPKTRRSKDRKIERSQRSQGPKGPKNLKAKIQGDRVFEASRIGKTREIGREREVTKSPDS